MRARKKKRGKMSSNAARKLIAIAHYAVLTAHASDFGVPFWFLEQRRSRIADRLDNKESAQ